tara:strand:+ start:24663 stop:25259 length:597 start_codon:yes stop_codon:yes gene_type:complete
MIDFINSIHEAPYLTLKEKYDQANSLGQEFIEAVSISSYSRSTNEVDSRYVNLKFIDGYDFIFFSNYNSPKSIQFDEHDQVTAVFFWPKINTQIRIKAKIKKIPKEWSQKYFESRQNEKNALAISSNQSQKISSYEDVVSNYEEVLKKTDLNERPSYWGGFSFRPYYFEFWEGRKFRLNKRDVFEMIDDDWCKSILQP